MTTAWSCVMHATRRPRTAPKWKGLQLTFWQRLPAGRACRCCTSAKKPGTNGVERSRNTPPPERGQAGYYEFTSPATHFASKSRKSGNSKHLLPRIVEFGIEHELSKRCRRSLNFRGSECEQCHDIPLRLWRKLVEVLFHHCVPLLARHTFELWIDDPDANGGRVLAIRVCLFEMLSEKIFDFLSFGSALGFPKRCSGRRHGICPSTQL